MCQNISKILLNSKQRWQYCCEMSITIIYTPGGGQLFSFCFCVNRCVVLVELTSIKRETGVNCHTRRGKCKFGLQLPTVTTITTPEGTHLLK